MPKAKPLELTTIGVHLRTPFDMPSRLAQHLSVQDLGEIVQLSFFEIVFPYITDDTTEEERNAIQTGGLVANCVSKVHIPRSRYADFVKAMNTIKPSKNA